MKRLSKILVLLFIGINLFLFVYLNQQPLPWQQREIIHLNFLWSRTLSPDNPYLLDTGLHLSDFKKLFMFQDIEMGLRFRQFSSLVQMISFKFWQQLGVVMIRDYTAVILHLLNAILLWFLMKRWSKSSLAAWICSLMFLNSGSALFTLIFPFRITKVLGVNLFLLALLLGYRGQEKKGQVIRLICFYSILLLMLFTDESSFLLVPGIFLLLKYVEKDNKFVTPKAWFGLLGTFVAYGVLVFCFKSFVPLSQESGGPNLLSRHLQESFAYFHNPLFLRDIFRSFFNYFLRTNFGSWGYSFLEGAAFGAFVGLLILLFRHTRSKASVMAFLLINLFNLLKNMFYFSQWGVQTPFMPADTFFPTVLYFIYYYPYVDSILFIMSLGVLFSPALVKKRMVCLTAFGLVTLISVSNLVHCLEVARDDDQRIKVFSDHVKVTDILSIQDVQSKVKNEPVYLSFPSGSQPTFKMKWSTLGFPFEMDPGAKSQRLNQSFVRNSSLVLAQYLRPIKEGHLIVSLENIKRPKDFPANEEILGAKFFYDVRGEDLVDLDFTRGSNNNPYPKPKTSQENLVAGVSLKDMDPSNKEIHFFVKGGAEIIVKDDKKMYGLSQFYGYSYQHFRVALKKLDFQSSKQVLLMVRPAVPGSSISVWGPFVK